jgi:Zn finger protein HypA/HybF involved in hydrogenase expression
MGIALEIHRACRDTVDEHGGGVLEKVRLAVGELSAVEPDLLRFAWEALTTDGPDQGSELVIEWRPAHQHCPDCGEGKDRAEGSWLRLCPDCGGPLVVEGGSELDLLEVTFSAPEEGAADDASSAPVEE